MKLDLDECNNPSKGSILFYQFKKQNVTKIAALVDLFIQPNNKINSSNHCTFRACTVILRTFNSDLSVSSQSRGPRV